MPPESSACTGRARPKAIGDPVSSDVAGVSTAEDALVPAEVASEVPSAVDAVLASPPPALPVEAWEPVSPLADGAAVPLAATWDDRAEAAVPPEPEPEAVGVATALLDVAAGVEGLPPESPEMATGSLVEIAVASPVFPLFEAEELAVAGPESPVVAVGLDTTLEAPPLPPLDVPVVALPPAPGPAKAGDAKNSARVITAAAATHERIDRRLVASAMNPVLRG